MAQEGLVRIFPRRGMFVSDVTIKDICDLYELKEVLEPIIVRTYGHRVPKEKLLAFQDIFSKKISDCDYLRADADFHALMIDACDNKYYKLILDIVSEQSQRIRILTHEDPARSTQSDLEHLKIIHALLENDFNSAADAMEKHYHNCLTDIMRFKTVSEILPR